MEPADGQVQNLGKQLRDAMEENSNQGLGQLCVFGKAVADEVSNCKERRISSRSKTGARLEWLPGLFWQKKCWRWWLMLKVC